MKTTPTRYIITNNHEYVEQPVLDVFHKQSVKLQMLASGAVNIPSNIPSIF